MEFLLFIGSAFQVEVPTGGVSPLAWAIIGALALAIAAVVPALWSRGNKIQDRMYEDLKTCNEKRAKTEEDVLGTVLDYGAKVLPILIRVLAKA